jgi:hypothetical protein
MQQYNKQHAITKCLQTLIVIIQITIKYCTHIPVRQIDKRRRKDDEYHLLYRTNRSQFFRLLLLQV